MEVEIRGYKGTILNMVKHQDVNLYEIQLLNNNKDIETILHKVKPEEIKIIPKVSKGSTISLLK